LHIIIAPLMYLNASKENSKCCSSCSIILLSCVSMYLQLIHSPWHCWQSNASLCLMKLVGSALS